jgi:hypothetical protein
MRKLLPVILSVLLLTTGCIVLDEGPSAPTAYIDSISPSEVASGGTVSFDGHGTDADGTIVAYRWKSDKDGELSAKASFETNSLSVGEHLISFKVQDNTGEWSEEVMAKVIVTASEETEDGLPVISVFNSVPDSIEAGDSSTISWSVSGALSIAISPDVGTVSATTGSTDVFPDETTTYTLTAVNGAGSTTATAEVVVSDTSTPAGVPVIDFFTSDPWVIVQGESTTLAWSVTNADLVTIDPGVGAVDTEGTASISPVITTSYTLTATNSSGWSSATLNVTVEALVADSTAPSVPSIVSPSAGAILPQPKFGWTFDWTDSADAESGIRQYEIYVKRASSTSPLINKTTLESSYSGSTAGTITQSYLNDWQVKVRAQNNAGLWSNWSAIVTFSVEQNVVYDFIENAPSAQWWSGLPLVDLIFPGSGDDHNGFVRYLTDVKLNDGHTYDRVLETHPKWVDNGFISGRYSDITIPGGAKLVIRVGFINNALAGNVTFKASEYGESPIFSVTQSYSGGVDEYEYSLSSYAGQTIDMVLNVNAAGVSTQDWATWIEARIVN